MQHNDIRHSMCHGCAAFVREELSKKYMCLETLTYLRTGKHKIPLKHQSCKGPHDDMSTVISPLDEFNKLTDEQRELMAAALESGVINKTYKVNSHEQR